jgi:hypothetical protein
MTMISFRRWLASVRVPHGNKTYLQDRAYEVIDELQSNLDALPATVTSARQVEVVIIYQGLHADSLDAEDLAATVWERYRDGWKE